jgi:triosephosphate isomerase
MRTPIVAGNWKMNKTASDAAALVSGLTAALDGLQGVDVVLCPPFTALQAVSELIADTSIDLGAQNMHFEESGAFTGEISGSMLRDLYCHYVILGHSERRQYFGETDELVNKKAKAALAAGLKPIVCVGETLEERESNRMKDVIDTQVRRSLVGLGPNGLAETVIAYEPVWAIGTGKTATSEQAQEVHEFIRGVLADLEDDTIAQAVRIQYGGSMKPGNAAELLAQPDIDGGLIGGAALDAESFAAIVQAAV